MITQRIERICQILDEKKGEALEVFDLRETNYFVDFVILVNAFIDKHALALLDELKVQLKPAGEQFLNVQEGSDWIVIDLGDILIHIFTENHRKKFNLEEFLMNIKKEAMADKA